MKLFSKALITGFAVLMIAAPAYAQQGLQTQQPADLNTVRSEIAVKIFQKACLKNYGKYSELPATLDKYFPRQSAEETKTALALLGAKKGTAWTANAPEGAYTIVQDPDTGVCNVIADSGNGFTVHAAIKKLAQTAFISLKNNTVDYKSARYVGIHEISSFTLNGFGEEALITVVAKTWPSRKPGEPATILTMTPK